MIHKNRFDPLKLKGKLGRIRYRISNRKPTSVLLFFLTGIFSTIWFLVRVIPKPARASYPCMRVAAPFMSGLIVYLLSVGGLTIAARKSKRIINVRILSAFLLTFGMLIAMAITPSDNEIIHPGYLPVTTGPDDGPNQPVGAALGVKPGRVIWDWDTTATNRDCRGYYFNAENTNPEVINAMFDESVIMLTGESSVSKSWDAMFRYFNLRKHNINRGYDPGEKIFIKINQTSGRGRLKQSEREKGNFNYPVKKEHQSDQSDTGLGTCETSPYLVLQLLRQLVDDCGIKQSDIAIGDPQNPTFGHNYEAWSEEFPEVLYTDRTTGKFGRTLIHPTKNDLLFYSDKFQTDKLYDIIENAEYLINVANLKPHSGTGITLTAKNHFGSQSRSGAYHLHYSHLSQIEGKPPSNAGYHKYRVLVDLMGSKYLGRNTLLYIIDGLYGGGASEGGPPVKYFMTPFNGNWSSSIFISQDQVALESVCYDFLRTEWNGTFSHDPSNNFFEAMPAINGVDDYLHQAADAANWPKGIIYDPDNSGKPIPSLGVHEHWNNPVNKQYSRNLGRPFGIELVSIPSFIDGSEPPQTVLQTSNVKMASSALRSALSTVSPVEKGNGADLSKKADSGSRRVPGITKVVTYNFREGFSARRFYSGALDDNNGKWFLTDAGVVRGDLFSIQDRMDLKVVNGTLPVLRRVNPDSSSEGMKSFVYELTEKGPSLWIATNKGVISALIHEDSDISEAIVYDTLSSGILNNNVIATATGRNQLRWFGTGKGVSALSDKKWLAASYRETYPENLFKYYPITALATTVNGDSLYVATGGAGVARVFRDEVDAISGASSYQQWGPIEMPSDTVYSLCIARDGTQWIGTNRGVARHSGYNTLENWTIFNTDNGLADNSVQAIATDPYGRYVWIGTKGGISVYDGTEWTSFTLSDGLISNNILFILIDKNGLVYFGTDKGIMVYTDDQLACYK